MFKRRARLMIMVVVMMMLVMMMMPVMMFRDDVVLTLGCMSARLRARPHVMMVVQQTACRRGQQIGRDCNSAGNPGDEHCDTLESTKCWHQLISLTADLTGVNLMDSL